MSFDSNFEYYVGLFMAPEVKKAVSKSKDATQNPFTVLRRGERSYSASVEQRKHAYDNEIHALRHQKPVIPKAPNLAFLKKNGDGLYSSSSGRPSTRNRIDSFHKSVKNVGPPRLALSQIKGERIYSTFAGPRSSDTSIESSRAPSPRLKANLHPPKLTLTEKLGERHYSLFSSSASNHCDCFISPSKTVNHRPPRLRLSEMHGQRLYSTSTPTHRYTLTDKSWNPSRKLRLTVPKPFNLSSSNYTIRAQEGEKAKFHFKALPCPDFSKIRFGTNIDHRHNANYTKPNPFQLSVTNQGARSYSSTQDRAHCMYKKSSTNVRKNNYQNHTGSVPRIRRMRKGHSNKEPPQKRQKSMKSKYRIALKHQGRKVIKIAKSFNPNLNASRAARERYLLKVALEVAKLREEWLRYKEEAQRLSDEIEAANIERVKLHNELSKISDKEEVKIEAWQKRLAKLNKALESKSELLFQFQEELMENEKKQRLAATSFKERNDNGRNQLEPILIYGKQRSFRKVMSFKESMMISNRCTGERSEEDNVAFGPRDASDLSESITLKKIGIEQIHSRDSERRLNSDRKAKNLDSAPRDQCVMDCQDTNEEESSSKRAAMNPKSCTGERSEEDNAAFGPRDASDLSESITLKKIGIDQIHSRGSERRLNSDRKAKSLDSDPRDQCVMDSRDMEEENSSNRDDEICERVSGEAKALLSQKSTTSDVKEKRPKGNGDDFSVSSLTTMFRGGWHRALRHEHLANKHIHRYEGLNIFPVKE